MRWNKNRIAMAVGLLILFFTAAAIVVNRFFPKNAGGGSEIAALRDAGNRSLDAEFCEAYLQTDERWAADRMGEASDTMAESGCLTCCLAASLTAQGEERRTPGEWNQFFSENGVYNDNAAILWGRLEETIAGVTVNLENDMSVESIYAALEDGQYPIVKVRRKSGAYHWVMLLRADKEEGEVYCLDPIDGYVSMEAYKNKIYAVRIVTAAQGG